MEPAAYSIDEFCLAHHISRGMFYKLLRAGKAPQVMCVGTHKRISKEAAAEWRRQCEKDARSTASAAA